MAFCTACGSPLEEGVAFCTRCGAPVEMQPAPGVVRQEAAQAPGMTFQQEMSPDVAQAAHSLQQQNPQQAFEGQQGAWQQQAQGWQQQAPYGQIDPYAQQFAPQKKSKKGLIIGLSAGAAALIVAIVLLIIFWPFGSFAGRWQFHSMNVFGMTITRETFSSMGFGNSAELSGMFVEITEDNYVTLSALGQSISAQGTVSGKTLTIREPYSGTAIDFTLERGKLTFNMTEDGLPVKFIFERE